jgi:hypothetical protein
MTEQYFDHVDQQYPYSLIGPLREQVQVLEDRAHHYVHHVRMSDGDRETMARVQRVLADARAELEKLRNESGKPTE